MASNKYVSLRLVAIVALSMYAQQTAADFILSGLFDVVAQNFKNATNTMELMLNHEVPAVKNKAVIALNDYAKTFQNSAKSIHDKVVNYNVTTSALTGLWDQLKGNVKSTVNSLSVSSPQATDLLGQVKSGFSSMVEVGKKVSNALETQGAEFEDGLKDVAQHVHSELSRAATQLENTISSKVQPALAG